MPIRARKNLAAITIKPDKLRYSLEIDHLGKSRREHLTVQRADKRADGTWIDDPRPGARQIVDLPNDGPTKSAVKGLMDLLPTILVKVGVSDPITDARLRLSGSLSLTGVLDVMVIAQVRTGDEWTAKVIPSLNSFVSANAELAAPIATAWAAMDDAIERANAKEEWI